MTVSPNKVRDFTGGPTGLQVDVVHGEVYETLAALYAIPDCVEAGTDYEDSTLIEGLKNRLDDELAAAVLELADPWSVYLGLLGFAYDAGVGDSMADFLEKLRSTDPVDLRRTLLTAACPTTGDAGQLEAAASGDVAAIDAALGEHHEALRDLLLADSATSVDRLINLIERFYDVAMKPDLATLLPTLERDAHDKKAISKTLTAEALVEKATKGVTFEPSAGVGGIVVVPSIVLRPWTLMVQHGSLRIFVYSVDEEVINADPTAPPSYLVEMYKALGDERRLQMLAELWGGDTDLKTLSQKLDLAKSTTHHHLRALRAAGLVRVVLRDHDKVYSLRKEGLADAGPLLEEFLSRLLPKE